MPNLVDLFQKRKVRALALDLGEDERRMESELIAFKGQYMPIGFRIYELRQLFSERFFDHLIKIVRHLLSPNQHASRIISRESELVSLYSERNWWQSRNIALILMLALTQIQPFVRDPGVDRLNNYVSLCWLLSVKNANRYIDSDSNVRDCKRLIILNLQKLPLERREIAFIADEWLDERVLNRHRLAISSRDQRLDSSIYLLVKSVDFRANPSKVLVGPHKEFDENLFVLSRLRGHFIIFPDLCRRRY